MKSIFWLSFAVVFYVYFGYPMLLVIWQRISRKPVVKGPWEPFVTLVMAAHNERGTIAEKIANCLELDYPRNKLQFIVSLDGPTDGTNYIAQRFENLGIEVLYCEQHLGKAAALNRALAAAHGDVIVFVDARQRVDRNALRALVANFRDSSVGAVSGELILLDSKVAGNKQALSPVGLYWRYEKLLRAMESRIHSAVGASGALYAIRRNLIPQLPEDTILDDVMIPMQTILAGKRVVFEPTAIAYDWTISNEAEFGRKVRTLMGNYQLLFKMPEVLNPWRNPVFLQYLSHKIGRLVVPYCLMALFVSNIFLRSDFYLVFLVLQLLWYLLAGVGAVLLKPPQKDRIGGPLLSRSGYEEGA